jgi:hypothetical protein
MLRCGQSVVGDDILTTVDVNGYDFPPLGRLDLVTDLSFVEGIAAPGCLLGGITGLPGCHEVSPPLSCAQDWAAERIARE